MIRRFFDARTAQFVLYVFRAYPTRSVLMIGLLIVSGLAEGVGLVTLLPLLEYAVGEAGQEQSELTQVVVGSLESLGLPPGLGPLLFVIVLAMSTKAFFRWLAMKQVGYTVAQVATDLRLRLIRALLRAEWRFFAQKPTGYFANAISSEAKRASSAYQMVCQSFAGLVQVVVYLTVVVLVSWEVALIAIAMAPVVTYALKKFVAMSREAGDEQTYVMRSLISRITALLPGIKPVKAMARERHLFPFLEKETEGFNRARQRAVLASESLRAFQEPVIVLVMAAGLYGAVSFGTASASAVIVAAVLFYRVMTTAGNLQTQYQSITVNESAFWSLMDTVEEAEAAAEDFRVDGLPAPPLEQGIRLENVSFRYEDEPVLRSVSLEIPGGELVTLVGASGAGKTTLVDLLTGLMEPDEGRILADEIPLDQIDLTDWRRQIGYVPQDMKLFNDTILQNVTLGEESFGRSDVERALRAAGAWEFVQGFPDGMDRQVGEAGAQLSGGQRQRIAIARALIGNPRLLILDEATTALDPETEQMICESLLRLRGQVTMVAISHQPAIREVSSRSYMVAGGRVTLESSEGAVSESRVGS